MFIGLFILRYREKNKIKTNVHEICDVGYDLGSSGSFWGPLVSCCEHGNELEISIKGKEFLD
jgi:hypothetical protein